MDYQSGASTSQQKHISTFEEVLPELDTTQISTGEGYRVVVSAFDFAGVADCEPYHRRIGEESAAWAVP